MWVFTSVLQYTFSQCCPSVEITKVFNIACNFKIKNFILSLMVVNGKVIISDNEWYMA
jgi:hypothetical protein